MDKRDRDDRLTELGNHFVIININEKLPAVVRGIQEGLGFGDEGRDIVIVVQDEQLWREHAEWHPVELAPHRLHVVTGCPGDPEDLCLAHLDRCSTALILADPAEGELSDAKCALIALAIEQQNPRVHTVIELVQSKHRVHLARTEVNEVVCMGKLAEELLAQCTISPGILAIIGDLLDNSPDSPSFRTIPVPEALIGLSYREAVERSIDEEHPYAISGYCQRGNGRRILNPRGPDKDVVLGKEDDLVVIG